MYIPNHFRLIRYIKLTLKPLSVRDMNSHVSQFNDLNQIPWSVGLVRAWATAALDGLDDLTNGCTILPKAHVCANTVGTDEIYTRGS